MYRKPIAINGVWRLWCEHAGSSDQIQGAHLDPFDTTNPDHCFEIHPLVEVAGRNVRGTFQAIEGFKNKDAEAAFERYENIRTSIQVANGKTTIFTNAVGFNYVEFIMELQEKPTFESEDALFVRSNVQDLNDELLVRNRRMVFVKGTAAEQMVRPMKKGDRLASLSAALVRKSASSVIHVSVRKLARASKRVTHDNAAVVDVPSPVSSAHGLARAAIARPQSHTDHCPRTGRVSCRLKTWIAKPA